MAKTRKKIAEQILRMVSGGNVSDDSSIDIREVMALVDQERDALIKAEIMGTGDFEVRGELLSKERLYTTDNSYVSLNNIPIGLPNDMGIFKVQEAESQTLTKAVRKLTLSGTIASNDTLNDQVFLRFLGRPMALDKKYRISFTVNIEDDVTASNNQVSAATHKISFSVYPVQSKTFMSGSAYDISRWNNTNLIRSIVSSKEGNSLLGKIGMSFGMTPGSGGFNTAAQYSSLDIQAKYNFNVTDFKINGEDSGGSHKFEWDQTKSDSYSIDTTPQTSSLTVLLTDGNVYSLSYGDSNNRPVEPNEYAQSFVDLNAQRMATESGIELTADGSVLSFKEITPQGGRLLRSIDAMVRGDISSSLETLGNYSVNPDRASDFYEQKVFTRMPSGGHTSSLYHETIIKSGRRFFYIEGNKVYLYKNYDKIDALDVWYIASSSSISNNDVYPVSADFEKQIITNLVQLFTVMKQAKEDLVNDNIG
tara:strand:- start:273 stop:1706 length:1434 start_codon:yes stop_codon:yes gene_type:complete